MTVPRPGQVPSGPLLGPWPHRRTTSVIAISSVRVACSPSVHGPKGARKDRAGDAAAAARARRDAGHDLGTAFPGRQAHARIERRIRDAAVISRFPDRLIAKRLPDAEERRVLTARLSSAGIGLEEATKELGNPAIEWGEAIRRTAGELTGAWDQLRALAGQEYDAWDRRTIQIRDWRRPWRPLLLTGVALLVLAIWLGMVLGGFLPVPGFMRPVADWYWRLPWP